MGIPPFVGFMGKLYVFAAVIERGPAYAWYAVVARAERRDRGLLLLPRPEDDDHRRRQRGEAGVPAAPRRLAWVVLLVLANVVPLFFWSQVEGWARASLSLYAGR